jgi:zinc transport system substrate-binding protein
MVPNSEGDQRVRRILLCLAVAATALVACGEGTGGEETVTVVASFYPLAEAARRVGGHDVDVMNLTPAGTEPHDLELTPDQVDAVEDADVVLYLGGGFQPAVEEVAERRADGTVDLLAELELTEDEDGEVDPHFWLDPMLLAKAVDRIEAALAAAEPVARTEFEAHADDYRDDLAALDEELSRGLATCERRDIVTSHAAFSYLARRYDLEQVAIAGLSPEAEPDPDRLSDLTDLIAERGVTTVFYEALVSPDVAETLAREARVGTAVLDPIEGLSEEDADADRDYATVMRRNLEALRKALGCS